MHTQYQHLFLTKKRTVQTEGMRTEGKKERKDKIIWKRGIQNGA